MADLDITISPSASITMPIVIRTYETTDAASVVEIFRSSVRGVPVHDYSQSQVRAWAPDVIDEERFGQRCESKSTWIAKTEDRIAGFSDLEPDGHVDMLYVHPDFQRRGIARALLQHVEAAARALELRRLYTEASITARPAFEAAGFHVIVPQIVAVRGETMTNYRMEKRLNGPLTTSPTI